MKHQRMNVLVYSGTGSGAGSLFHCLYTLRKLLGVSYAVVPVSRDQIVKEPWPPSCAAIIFPGGADREYCHALNGRGNHLIRRFVEDGGIYIGFCAGGYYGSQKCEFEVGNKPLEVIGQRELAFFPGTARGAAFPGFVYDSEQGARAAQLQVHTELLPPGSSPSSLRSYYNGGGVFVDAAKYQDQGVEVLASYTEELAVDPGEGSAAIIHCKFGQGHALLTGSHPEFAAINLHKNEEIPGYDKVVDALLEDEKRRDDLMMACLTRVGLKVSEQHDIPSLSTLHLSSLQSSNMENLVASLQEIITLEQDGAYIMDNNDKFHIVNSTEYDLSKSCEALPLTSPREKFPDKDAISIKESRPDPATAVKRILIYGTGNPLPAETPYFDHHVYFSHLVSCQSTIPEARSSFGCLLFYGQVVTSTNSLLEKNTQLLCRLPTGFTAVATTQLAGRGRGSNVWVSPPGSLMFSVVIRHPMTLMQTAPIVFVQYLAALAVVESIKAYGAGRYKDLPLKLKWPNDIYALDPARVTPAKDGVCEADPTPKHDQYVKIGGILVNSHYDSQDYIAVCGIGLNLSNTLPTISLNALASYHLSTEQHDPHMKEAQDQPPITPESLLPSILTTFDSLYSRFVRTGFDSFFQQKYYVHWLHDGQIITLEAGAGNHHHHHDGGSGGDVHARIKGITNDFGLLLVEEVVPAFPNEGGREEEQEKEGKEGEQEVNNSNNNNNKNNNNNRQWKGTGQMWQLQSDSNSFDFFHGLIKRKV